MLKLYKENQLEFLGSKCPGVKAMRIYERVGSR
jgi:hypothetical protein